MSVQNKILIALIAVTAFVVGVALNTAKVSDDIDISALLTAELSTENGPATVNEQLEKLTLVNFWASWCSPCREEMPIFETMYRSAKSEGFQIIGIAVDSPEKTQAMLDSMGITYPILYAEQTGMEIMELSGNPQGLMPYSLLLDENGKVLEQVLGKIDEHQIVDWLNESLAVKIAPQAEAE